jgi:hypothetical protein
VPSLLVSGLAYSGPHAVGQPNGTVDVFWRGQYGTNLDHAWYNVGVGWSGGPAGGGEMVARNGCSVNGTWQIGCSLQSDPSPVVSSPSVVDVFWQGTDNNLWHTYYLQGWQGPTSLGFGPLASGPHAAGQSNGTIDVFWKGSAGQLMHAWFYTGITSWKDEDKGGSIGSELWATGSALGVVYVFWTDSTGYVWYSYYHNGWNWFVSTSIHSVASAPRPAGQQGGTVDVFWKETSGNVGHAYILSVGGALNLDSHQFGAAGAWQ